MRRNFGTLPRQSAVRDLAHHAAVGAALWVSDTLRYPLMLGDYMFGTQRCTGSVADQGVLTQALTEPISAAIYLVSPWIPKCTQWSTPLINEAMTVLSWASFDTTAKRVIRVGTLPLTHAWTLAKATILGPAYGIGYV
ncbi:MAG: hypothetical protein EOO38_25890, partial [Cytophagaceae bacterium]